VVSGEVENKVESQMSVVTKLKISAVGRCDPAVDRCEIKSKILRESLSYLAPFVAQPPHQNQYFSLNL